MNGSERRQLTRYNLRTPLRFRATGLSSDKTEHFTEALNVSRGGFLLRDVGAAADRHADRGDSAHARRSYRRRGGRDAMQRSSGARIQPALQRRTHWIWRGD